MHLGLEQFRKAMRDLGREVDIVELDESAHTATDAAKALGVDVGQIAKSILFMAGEEPVLVIASGAHRIDPDKLAVILGRSVQLADPDAVMQLTGYEIGGVPPVGHRIPLKTIIDESLFQYDKVYAAAGSPRAIFACHPGTLVNWTDGLVAKIKSGT
ncbi:MAG: YbaK/EbsC family protein [Alicyclobacillaceae bacterium]|nr:YbaK/EbsC family protein [Alicyclobacillaceae bacterium]